MLSWGMTVTLRVAGNPYLTQKVFFTYVCSSSGVIFICGLWFSDKHLLFMSFLTFCLFVLGEDLVFNESSRERGGGASVCWCSGMVNAVQDNNQPPDGPLTSPYVIRLFSRGSQKISHLLLIIQPTARGIKEVPWQKISSYSICICLSVSWLCWGGIETCRSER